MTLLEIDADNTIAYRDQWGRQARTLLNQFPFNQGAHHQGSHHGAHHGHGNHHGHHQTGHLDHGNHGQHGFQNGFPQLHQGTLTSNYILFHSVFCARANVNEFPHDLIQRVWKRSTSFASRCCKRTK